MDTTSASERRRDDYISRRELDERIAELEKRTEWELGEWYDKFSTLHARASKRQQRSSAPTPQNGREPEPTPMPSALHYRKPWSV